VSPGLWAALTAVLLLLAASLAFLEGRRGHPSQLSWIHVAAVEVPRVGLGVLAALALLAGPPWLIGVSLIAIPLALVFLVDLLPWHLGARFHSPLQPPVEDEPLRELLDQGREAGMLAELEHDVIGRVLSFDELTVGRLMTPRREMFTTNLEQPWPALLSELREAAYSRVPVWEGSRDNIIGVLLVKDLLATLLHASAGVSTSPRQLRRLVRPARFVPTTRRAVDMLAELRTHKLHLALVVDEHGTVVGLITLDDLLTELVGELPDENDEDPDPLVRRVGDRSWLVSASMDAEDFAERFALELPDGDFNSVGGLVINELGDLAHTGDRVELASATLTVRRVDGRRITDLLLEVESPAAPAEEEA